MKFKIIKNFEKIKIGQFCDHYFYDFNPNKKFKKVIFATMHQSENFNNIEVLKFAIWCQKKNIKLIMYGFANQLPLFSIFADAVLLQDVNSWSKDLYEDKSGTSYNVDQNFFQTIRNYERTYCNGVFDLSRNISFNQSYPLLFDTTESEFKTWPLFLEIAENEISNEEVVEKYSDPIIYIRQSAKNKYDELVSKGIIKSNILMCEVKTGPHCGGDYLLSCLKKATEDYSVEICTDIEFKKSFSLQCGQDYLSVQMLCSGFSNWMWACYGGSSNIFPFFPIKLISISDAYCRYELTRSLFRSRLGELGEVFPEFNTLLYCFPGEKDGPSRTDGHPPLPDFQKLVKDLSDLKIKSTYIAERIL
jgi:hypothetical protein